MSMAILKGGVAAAAEVDEGARKAFARWLEKGWHAGMAYMERNRGLRDDPRLLHPGTKTVLSLAVPFQLFTERDLHPELGMIAAYALGDDYHDAMRQWLRPSLERLQQKWGGEWRLCIDSAPVMERYWAVKSGLGSPTESGMVCVEEYGTACFLAEILIPHLPQEIGLPAEGPVPTDVLETFLGMNLTVEATGKDTGGCDRCRSCRYACPAGALGNGGEVDARRCLSYLSIEHRGPFETEEAIGAMGTPVGKRLIFGCDMCLRGCHLNYRIPQEAVLPQLRPRQELLTFSRERGAAMTQEMFSALFKGSPIKRAKLAGLTRNCRAIGEITLATEGKQAEKPAK